MLHCLYCGLPDLKTLDGNKYTCTGCNRTFYLNASGAAAVLLRDTAGNYLRTIRNRDPYKGCLDTAGGFIDPGETAEQAAIRECAEELGLHLDHVTYVGSFAGQYERCEIIRPIIDLVFIATLTKEQIMNFKLNDEITGVERYTRDTLPRERLAPSIAPIHAFLQ